MLRLVIARTEAALWRGIGQRLVWTLRVVVANPFVQGLLCSLQVAEHLPGVELDSKRLVEALDLATGPDGNLWFTEYSGNHVGRITPDGEALFHGRLVTAFCAARPRPPPLRGGSSIPQRVHRGFEERVMVKEMEALWLDR